VIVEIRSGQQEARTAQIRKPPESESLSLSEISPTVRTRIRGILFDVDGTLYHQSAVRFLMGGLLVLSNLLRPYTLVRRLRIISCFRSAQELMRTSEPGAAFKGQLELAAYQLGMPVRDVQSVVDTWMQQKPLPLIRLCRRRGIEIAIRSIVKKGGKVGVYSDYPSHEKLQALGILHFMSVVVSSSDSDVRSFKPSPNGFIVAAQKMQLEPSEILYVGDRDDTDGEGATRAGMKVVIISSERRRQPTVTKYPRINSFRELLELC
jgi:FMN phosphatase YigB (HAD superfamily)